MTFRSDQAIPGLQKGEALFHEDVDREVTVEVVPEDGRFFIVEEFVVDSITEVETILRKYDPR